MKLKYAKTLSIGHYYFKNLIGNVFIQKKQSLFIGKKNKKNKNHTVNFTNCTGILDSRTWQNFNHSLGYEADSSTDDPLATFIFLFCYQNSEKDWETAQLGDCLPSVQEALGSIPSRT